MGNGHGKVTLPFSRSSDTLPHPLCYAWSAPVEGPNRRRFFAVLHAGPVKSARDAVRASIVQTYREETRDAH